MILGVPVLKRYDLLDRMIRSLFEGTVRPTGVIVVDNGGGFRGPSDVMLVRPAKNLGVAASWNLMLDIAGAEPIVITNDDVVFGAHTFENLVKTVRAGSLFAGNGWFLFAQTPECTRRVGYYDENFFPAYCEDSDYEVRLHRAGVERTRIPVDYHHDMFGSSTPEESDRWRAAARAYFERKWGGKYLGEVPIESFGEPWGGAPPEGWKLRGVR